MYKALDQVLDQAKVFFPNIHIPITELDPFKVASDGALVDKRDVASQSEEA